MENPDFWPYFKDSIGAIDGTYIPADVPADDQVRYHNRHSFLSQNVMAACNFDILFQYVLAGWEGLAHDSRVLHDALTRNTRLVIPTSKYYLVDAGYGNNLGFLAPYRGVHYHLSDFQKGHPEPMNARELFNRRHSSLCNVIERTFGFIKKRFGILNVPPLYPYDTQVKIVLECCI